MRRPHLAWSLSWALLCSLAIQAQQAGYLDLTDTQSASTGWILPRECSETFVKLTCGSVTANRKEKFEISIIDLSSKNVHSGEEVFATLRVKNVGPAAASVPWSAAQDVVAARSLEGSREYDQVSLTLQLRNKGQEKPEIYLTSTAELYATEERAWTFLTLNPGEWVELSLKAVLSCEKLNRSTCSQLIGDNDAEITAVWREWKFTQERNGCEVDRGNLSKRHVDSPPVPVQLIASEK